MKTIVVYLEKEVFDLVAKDAAQRTGVSQESLIAATVNGIDMEAITVSHVQPGVSIYLKENTDKS